MMFPWSIAKSAEAVFSRWAVKRVCKFLLKKKLGKLLLGDIDLDQLDVQLRDGTIQLIDIALNVDYLNEKFDAPLLVKEGSIGSLLVKMPWKIKGCQVEVDELELVLAPRLECNSSTLNEASTSISTQEASHSTHLELGKHGNDLAESAVKSASVDVHEGVKTVAKIVKWFLTSFHVKINKLIIAFDPCFGKDQKEVSPQPTLVFRMSEIECGTCVPEDPVSTNEAAADNFLGISRLTNFVKFQGVVLELLQMDDDDSNKTCGSKPSNAVTSIVTGKGGGFSGSLNLSIPWRCGSLDIRKVDADVCIDPIEVRFQPATINWFLHSWETFMSLDSDCFGLVSHFDTSTDSSSIPTKKVTSVQDTLSSSGGQEMENKTTLPGLRFIPDWVPSSFSKKEEDGEVDFGASVDQFFECFDGMRSYQSALGSQGIWNWTSSVFTAITAASSLASGSLHLPSEHQHVQTSFKVSFSGISMVLFFDDEDNWKDACVGVHYLGAECRDISVSVQVWPQEMRLEGKVNNIEITDYFHAGDVTDTADIEYQTASIKNLQAEVENALPLFASPDGNVDSNEVSEIVTDGFLSRNKGFAVKTLLVRAAGDNGFQFTINSQSSDGSFSGSKSFSLSLPPTTVWVNLHSVKRLVNLFNDMTKSIPKISGKKNQVSSPSHSENDAASRPRITAPSKSERLQGNVSIQNARAILCFPYEGNTKRLHNSLGEQFVVIDLSSRLSSDNERLEHRSPGERYFALAARSICFGIGDASIYLVTPHFKEAETNSYNMWGDFSAYKILHTCNGTDHKRSSITLFWQDSPATGPGLLERARNLATLEESMQSNKRVGNGLEFAAVTPAKDEEDIYSQTRKEITLGSSFCIWVHLFHPSIHLDSSLYSNMCHLLSQTKSWLTSMVDGTTEGVDEPAAVQTSLVVECDLFEILVRPDTKDDIKKPLQIELPGSWIQLKLMVQKLNLLSVSNLGNTHGADFFWLAHDEGKLWGSVSGFPDRELLLISCINSTMNRGNGGGSNALSSRLAGLDIVHLQDPQVCHGFLSISLRCSTIVAVGGRLDWAEVASSFFILPSTESVQVDKVAQERNSSSSSSPFILSLVDVGLSYEPHFENADPFCQPSESWIACLLAASSFSLSNAGLADSMRSGCKIRVQDLGLLLSVVDVPNRFGGTYSVEYLHETGYVKVAQQALVEAIMRTNCENGLLWELECSESHLLIETCYDTTSGLIHLAAQIQQLFAPDLEESAVHLQTRWDNIQQAHARNDFDGRNRIFGRESSNGKLQNSSLDAETESGLIGLMDEINPDAFNFEANMTSQSDSLECQSHCMSSDDSFHGEACTVILGIPDTLSSDQFICGSSSEIVPESSQTFLERDSMPDLIENYLSDLHPLSEVPLEGDLLGRESVHEADMKRRNSGWYDDGSLRIVEDHVSEATEEDSEEHTLDSNSWLFDSSSDSVENALGRVLLKNVNLKWKMFSGSDWYEHGKKSEIPRNMKGRDANACLELELSAMQFQYEVFPVGGICASKLSLMVHDFYLYDMSKAAPWKLVLGYYNSKDCPRDSSSKALKLDLNAVRPEPQTPLEEYRLRIAFLPVLLHLHQSQLDFLISFFGGNGSEVPLSAEDSGASTSIVKIDSVGHNIGEEALLPYFQKFDIWPVTVRIDYSPHHVDLAALTGGKYAELVNLVPWKGVELKLKHVHAAGMYGWGSVCETILGEWLEDISQNQIHKLLRGIPTVRSLSALYAGAAKLISLPVESYRKDRRVVQGVQRGTIALLRSISLEAVGLGVHLAAGAHNILLRAEYVLASSPTVSQSRGKKKANVRHNQPRNAGQGVLQACESISHGLGKSASALVRKPFKQYQRGASMGSALATAVQGVPTAAIAPASACARALHSALIGIRNSLDPEHKKESMEKYLGPDKRHNQN